LKNSFVPFIPGAWDVFIVLTLLSNESSLGLHAWGWLIIYDLHSLLRKASLVPCHCTAPACDIFGALHEARYFWHSTQGITAPTSFLHRHWHSAQSIAICFSSSRDVLVPGPTNSAPISWNRTSREFCCLDFTTANSSWADSYPKAHGSLDGSVLLGLFPTVTPQFPCPRLIQTMKIMCSGKPEPWLLLKLHDVLVVLETWKPQTRGPVSSNPPFLLVFSAGLSPWLLGLDYLESCLLKPAKP
jgi:hypothetical protein